MSSTTEFDQGGIAEYDVNAHRASVLELGHAIIDAAISDPDPQYADGFAAGVLPDVGGVMIGRSRHLGATTVSLEESGGELTVYSYIRRPAPAKNHAEVRSMVSVVGPQRDVHAGSVTEFVFPAFTSEIDLSVQDVRAQPYNLFHLEKDLLSLRDLMVHRKRGLFSRPPVSRAS